MFPSCRYAVVNGRLQSKVIKSEAEEREGWLPSPHRFRALTVQELLFKGHHPDEAAALHQRELRRVKLIFAGHSLDEAEVLADAPTESSTGDGSAEIDSLRADNADMAEKLDAAVAEVSAKQAEIDDMTAKFEKNWQKKIAELSEALAENKKLKKALAKQGPKETVSED